jgi:hypothetical protein
MLHKLSSQVVDMCIEHCKKEENKTVIKNSILDPLIMHILEKIQPLVIASAVYFITTLILLIILLVILVWPRNTNLV